ncbi:hypothetical protein DFS34DRAFT_664332 [Phlyctochytrium arcticum]|nr:hypothetical protein DFS34DRAFT_664332 [Phlyctochytrium arcticum]
MHGSKLPNHSCTARFTFGILSIFPRLFSCYHNCSKVNRNWQVWFRLSFIKYGADPNVPKLASLCPNLTILNMAYCETPEDQELLNIVRNCKSLEELSIENCWEITSQGLGLMLPLLKNLRTLSVANFEISGDCLLEIAKMCHCWRILTCRAQISRNPGYPLSWRLVPT